MLRAITVSGEKLIIAIDDVEVRDLDLPDGVLTESELSQVRSVRTGAMPGYICKQDEVPEVEP